jgi:YbbR domain-containing protein
MKQVLSDMSAFVKRFADVLSRRDLVPKLVSLFLAAMLWAYIGSTKLAGVDYRVPIEIKNAPPGLVITRQNLNNITINLSGKKEDIANFNIKNVKAVVNLESAREGENQRFPIVLMKQEIPESIRVNISRKYVTLDMAKKLARRVAVEPVLSEQIKDGLVTGHPVVKPEYVVISGEEAAVKLIDTVRTEPIPVTGDAGKIDRDVAIDRSDLRGLEVNTGTVRVQFPVYEMENLFRFEVPLAARNLAEGFTYDVPRKKIRVFVKKTAGEAQVTAEDFEAYLDFSRVNFSLIDGQKEFTVNMRVGAALKGGREGASVVMVRPVLLQVKLIKKLE